MPATGCRVSGRTSGCGRDSAMNAFHASTAPHTSLYRHPLASSTVSSRKHVSWRYARSSMPAQLSATVSTCHRWPRRGVRRLGPALRQPRQWHLREEVYIHPILDSLPIGTVIDVGCGTGRHSTYLAERGHTVQGYDTSPGMLAIAREKVPGARFDQADVRALPVPASSADALVCALEDRKERRRPFSHFLAIISHETGSQACDSPARLSAVDPVLDGEHRTPAISPETGLSLRGTPVSVNAETMSSTDGRSSAARRDFQGRVIRSTSSASSSCCSVRSPLSTKPISSTTSLMVFSSASDFLATFAAFS